MKITDYRLPKDSELVISFANNMREIRIVIQTDPILMSEKRIRISQHITSTIFNDEELLSIVINGLCMDYAGKMK